MQAPGCILGPLSFLSWRQWADEKDKNQACKFPVASASFPIGAWRPRADGHDEDQACKLLGASSGSSAASALRSFVVGAVRRVKTMRRHVVRQNIL